MVDELLANLDKKGAIALKKLYKDNKAICEIVDAHLAKLDKDEAEAKAKADFVSGIETMTASLPHPADIANVYMAWREVDVPIGEPEEVEVNGVKEMRTPTTKVTKWVVEVNKGFQVVKSGSGTTASGKGTHNITVSKRNGNSLEPVGNFVSANTACKYLNLSVVGDSGTRVLNRNGYIIDAYTGNDFTPPK